MDFNRNTMSWCMGCHSPLDKAKFHLSPNPHHDKVLPLCKTCCNERMREYTKQSGNEAAGLYLLLCELGIPMIRSVYEVTKSVITGSSGQGNKPQLFTTYLKTLKEMRVKVDGVWQTDYSLCDFIDMDIGAEENEEQPMTEKELMEQRREWNKVWGKDYEDDDCELLDEYFDNYTRDIIEMDTAMTLRYRDLCKVELRKFKGDTEKETTDEILKLMKLLKIDQFQENKQSDTEKFIERMAWNIENTKPAECEDLEKYRDVGGFEKTWQEIMRCVRNLVAGSREFPEIARDEL